MSRRLQGTRGQGHRDTGTQDSPHLLACRARSTRFPHETRLPLQPLGAVFAAGAQRALVTLEQ